MRDVWERIQDWLIENVPRGYGGLRPGVTAKAIREAEAVLGVTLPEDLKASLRVHDGQRRDPGLIGGEGWSLFPLQRIVEFSQKWSQANPGRGVRLPLAQIGTGDYVFADLDPASERHHALLIQRRDTDAPDPLAPSFRAWLESFADLLENDELVYSEEDGEIIYADE